jgi:hypothetical protein
MRSRVATLRRVVKGDLRIEFLRQELTPYSGLELLRAPLGSVRGPGAEYGDYVHQKP